MTTLERERQLARAKLNDEGRYCVEVEPGLYAYGYLTHFSGLYVCFTCGHYCECGGEE